MDNSSVRKEGGPVKSSIETPDMRQLRSSYTHEVVGGKVVSWLTGRVILIQPPPDKPRINPHGSELEAIDSALEGEKQIRVAKNLGAVSVYGIDTIPNDLSSLQGTEETARELVPAS